MSQDLLESIEDGVAVLTMNRPERRNAMSTDMMGALGEALPRLANDSGVGCVVLTGAGNAFCAGGDVKAMAERDEATMNLESRIQRLRQAMEVSRWLHEMNKPTIAVMPGAAAGAGLSMALACDLRYAAAGAKMTTAFVNVALSGDFGGSYFLSKMVGTAKARELYYTSAVLTAEQAQALGIVNQVFAADRLTGEAMAVANKLASGPRITLGYMKRNMNAAETEGLAACFDLEAAGHARCAQTEDHKNAATAFAEKRAPVFVGR
jgi:2-(1,2-epoxy-1,2-dihydrophenyl)acetyl-CoA isomerase